MQKDILTEYDRRKASAARAIYSVANGAVDDWNAPASLKKLARRNQFKGEAGGVLADDEGVLLGVGDGGDPLISAAAADKLPEGDYVFADESEGALAALGWLMGGYRFDRYKAQPIALARLIAPEGVDVASIKRTADAVFLVRDLVNTPAADMDPAALEAVAREVAEKAGAEIQVTTGDALLDNNFPMVHAVGRAAEGAPRLIDLRWGDPGAPKVTLVGKGVTFDSGGLNIKGAGGMSIMKKDMGGAAHALALAGMIMAANLNVRLRVLAPTVENAIAGNAFRPGDVLTSRQGLTVEIGNTDAEGRLILADALTLGGEETPDLMVSLATLTGAARVALGPELAPFYCDDEKLAGELEASSVRVADPLWRMPLWRNYNAMLSSSIADVSHIGGGSFAGSITAALFLKRFVPASVPWMHFDIYAWRPKAAPGRPAGGEAQAIRALFETIAARYPA